MRFLSFLFIFLFSPLSLNAGPEASREKELLGLHYVPASFQTLSRLTWRFNLHDPSYDVAIDKYMRITNCPLYLDYYKDDFLWQRIREGARREIKYFSRQFPDRIEMVGGIDLGRYDFKTSSFILPEESRILNTGILSLPVGEGVPWNCRQRATMIKNPFPSRDIGFFAENPFSLLSIPVPPTEAKPLIERLAKYKYKNVRRGRQAILRVRVKATGLDRRRFDKPVGAKIIFKGQLDEIAVFEDPAMTKLIWKKRFKALD